MSRATVDGGRLQYQLKVALRRSKRRGQILCIGRIGHQFDCGLRPVIAHPSSGQDPVSCIRVVDPGHDRIVDRRVGIG